MREQKVVAVFGGSTPVQGDEAYQQGVRLGKRLAELSFAVATGGYMGTMEAVSRGAAEAGGHVIGVTSEEIESWRPIGRNPWVVEEKRESRLLDRLDRLIAIGDSYIALPGGIGTLTEISLVWSLLQIGAIDSKPLVLIGQQWEDVFRLFLETGNSYIHPRNVDLLYFVPNVDTALGCIQNYFNIQHGS